MRAWNVGAGHSSSTEQWFPDSVQKLCRHGFVPEHAAPVTEHEPATHVFVVMHVFWQSPGAAQGVLVTLQLPAGRQMLSTQLLSFSHGVPETLQVPSRLHTLAITGSDAPSRKWSRINTFGQPSYSALSAGPPNTSVLSWLFVGAHCWLSWHGVLVMLHRPDGKHSFVSAGMPIAL